MHLTALLTTAILAGLPAFAQPQGYKSMTIVDKPQWGIESLARACNAADTLCTWCFTIDTHEPGCPPVPCRFTVAAQGGAPASQSPASATCGPFTVTSGWSGQFGPGKGFTTLSVVDYARRLIVWPAYTDVQLCDGQVVRPDQCYAPVCLP